MLLCPNCNHNLTPLVIKPDPSSTLELDHCYFCGGVWFDHYEINRVHYNEAQKLITHGKTTDKNMFSGLHKCPRDGAKLSQRSGESIPPGVAVLKCSKCAGNFVTHNDLINLKKAQKIKLDYFKTWHIPIPALSSILIPAIVFSIATTGVFLTVRNVQKSKEARIKAQELIGTPTIIVSSKNSVLVSFSTTVPVTASVVYKEHNVVEPHTVPVSSKPSLNHTITIQNLNEKTAYTLKIYIEEAPGIIVGSPTYAFTTN